MLGSEPLKVDEGCVSPMKGLGYEHLGEYGIPGRHFFRKGAPPSHHVHWVRRGADFWEKQLVFRDYLRAEPGEAAAYAGIKRELAKLHADDRAAYTNSKTEFITRLLERAWSRAGATLIVFDLEATCWEEGQAMDRMETIEIGAVKLGPDLGMIDEYSAFVRPTREPVLSAFCTRLTSITQAQVDSAPTFPEALEKFRAWIGGGRFRLASWSAYDEIQIARDCALHGLEMPASLECHVDLQELYGRLKGCGRVTTSDALAREKISREGHAHRGIDDARSTVWLARFMIEPMLRP